MKSSWIPLSVQNNKGSTYTVVQEYLTCSNSYSYCLINLYLAFQRVCGQCDDDEGPHTRELKYIWQRRKRTRRTRIRQWRRRGRRRKKGRVLYSTVPDSVSASGETEGVVGSKIKVGIGFEDILLFSISFSIFIFSSFALHSHSDIRNTPSDITSSTLVTSVIFVPSHPRERGKSTITTSLCPAIAAKWTGKFPSFVCIFTHFLPV